MRPIRTSSEVEAALRAGEAVVALESTVLAHGLPHPVNLEVGRELERVVRARGGVPATVAVLGGVPGVGLEPAEMEHIATAEGVLKLSTRDLPAAAASGKDGATTVAATMWLAHGAGVQVFATGGIGGVHRGEPRDVSADLPELARTPVLVVCAGAKAILDLPATREMLETMGVLVLGWTTDELPAFYSRESGLGVDTRVDTADEVAAIWAAHREMGAPGGVLLCVPPPVGSALPADEVERDIERALESARSAGVHGKAITPYLLRELARLTGGRTLQANVALLRNNAGVAADVAAAIARR
jgi:pseudouridylate synthase